MPQWTYVTDVFASPREVNTEALAALGAGRVPMTPEELLPNPELPSWVERMREQREA